MQITVFTLFGGFVGLCLFSLRRDRRRAANGEAWDPGQGRRRWTAESVADALKEPGEPG